MRLVLIMKLPLNGHIFGINIVSQNEHAMVVDDRKKMTIKQAHSILGHVNRHHTIETAKMNGWIITDLKETFSCEGCQIAKAKRLIINKESRHKSATVGERLMIDISYAQLPNGSKTGKYWLLVVDETTSMKGYERAILLDEQKRSSQHTIGLYQGYTS
jgi:hypothetical protein